MSLVQRLRRAGFAAGIAALAFAGSAPLAHAGKLSFGPETVVRHLADVRLQNGEGEPLYLGYKLTFRWLGLPYAVSADGYVLGVRGKPVHYDIDQSRLLEWQGQGYVPSPLPEYRLSAEDYAFGYLAWIVAGLLALWYGGRALLSRRRSSRPVVAEMAPPSARDATPKLVKPQIEMLQPRPSSAVAQRPAQLPPVPPPRMTVAKTRCRVKSIKVA